MFRSVLQKISCSFFSTRAFATSADRVDVVIIGGGIMGSSTAYWLKERAGNELNVVIIEKDPKYTQASTVLCAGGIRQQFSLPENIYMSRFGAEFVKNIKSHCNCDDVANFKTSGYLTLVNDKSACILEGNCTIQREVGVKNKLLSTAKLKELFPWLNTEGVALGCLGLENEGWCDPWGVLLAIRNRACNLGAKFLNAEVVDFGFHNEDTLDRLVVKNNGALEEIQFNACVLSAGPSSGAVAKLAKIGTGEGVLSHALPVEPRKRFIYSFNCQGDNQPPRDAPMLIDMTGTWFRRESASFITGKSPPLETDVKSEDFDVDYEWFDNEVWPDLALRVPAFESVKMQSAWAGHYEHNTFDENGIVGRHPLYDNLLLAVGFSGHGFQHGPAVGRALSELIIDGQYTTIDLSRMGFDRLITNKPILEINII